MSSEKEDIKRLTEAIVNGLKSKGIDVTNAAIVKLGNDKEKQEQEWRASKEEKFPFNYGKQKEEKGFDFPSPDEIRTIISKIKEKIFSKEEEEEESKRCGCESCYNDFEKKYEGKGGEFDYSEVTLLGRKFKIKFWSNGNEESMIVSPEDALDKDSNLESLQNDLLLAVEQGRHQDATEIVKNITKLKNSQ